MSNYSIRNLPEGKPLMFDEGKCIYGYGGSPTPENGMVNAMVMEFSKDGNVVQFIHGHAIDSSEGDKFIITDSRGTYGFNITFPLREPNDEEYAILSAHLPSFFPPRRNRAVEAGEETTIINR